MIFFNFYYSDILIYYLLFLDFFFIINIIITIIIIRRINPNTKPNINPVLDFGGTGGACLGGEIIGGSG